MIPLGAQVRWRPDVYKAPPIGTVTARVGRMLDIDGRGWWVSEGLLEVVGEMANADGPAKWYDDAQGALNAAGYGPGYAADGIRMLNADLALAVSERDALQAVVVQQCEAMAEMTSAAEASAMRDEIAKLQDARDEIEKVFDDLRDAVRTMFLNVFDTREPSGMDCRAKGIDASDLIAEMARYE